MMVEHNVRIKQWIEGWKQAGIELEHLREIELPQTATSEALLALADAYESCRQQIAPSLDSGLVEQQAWFQKHRQHGQGAIPGEWLAEFEAAVRRPLAVRLRYAFIHTYKPVLDDAPYRAFDTMADYRRWCAEELPDWLGYGCV